MKGWARRHPNAMVVIWLLLGIYLSSTLTARINGRRWGWAVVSLVGFIICAERISHWYRQTDDHENVS